jgi:pyruvate dehydrogenase E1 component alpha subunit
MGTRIDQATANTALHERAAAFGLAARTVDGIDVEAVADAARALVDDARAGRPGFLAVDCYRFHGHARKDKSPYRDEAEEAAGRRRDPLAHARARLIAAGLAREDDLDRLDAEIAAEMDATIDFAIAATEPPLASMFRDVYAPTEPEPEPVRARIDRVLATE